MKQAIFAVVLMLVATICVTGCQSGALTYQTKTALSKLAAATVVAAVIERVPVFALIITLLLTGCMTMNFPMQHSTVVAPATQFDGGGNGAGNGGMM